MGHLGLLFIKLDNVQCNSISKYCISRRNSLYYLKFNACISILFAIRILTYIYDLKMKKEILHITEMKLVGLKTITNNLDEGDPSTAKIGNLIMNRYFAQGLPSKIPNRKNAGLTIGIYTEYESDNTGKYTYFVGEEVLSFNNIPEDFFSLLIPIGTYIKFTTETGEMPKVNVDAWKQIWQMNDADLGGRRIYKTDFEIYYNNKAEIFIGIDEKISTK